MRPQWRDAGPVRACGIALAQDRAIGQEGYLHALSFEDDGLPRLFQIASAAHNGDALIAQELYGVEKGIAAPVHRMVTRHRHDIEAAIAEDRCHVRLAPAVPSTGMDLQATTLRVDPLALAEADVAGSESRQCERAVSIHRFMDGAHIAASQQNELIVHHDTLPPHSLGPYVHPHR